MLLSTLGASMLGYMLTGKGMIRAGYDFNDLQSNKVELAIINLRIF